MDIGNGSEEQQPVYTNNRIFIKNSDPFRVTVKYPGTVNCETKEKVFQVDCEPRDCDAGDLADAIFNKYPQEDKEDVVFDLTTDMKKTYYPRTDTQFQELLWLLVAKNIQMVTVVIETPCKAFSDWSFAEVCCH